MKELIALMDQVQTSGAFSVGGTLLSILPGLRVNGVGPIGLPLRSVFENACNAHVRTIRSLQEAVQSSKSL